MAMTLRVVTIYDFGSSCLSGIIDVSVRSSCGAGLHT